MRKMIPLVALAAMLTAPAAFAESTMSQPNSGAGVPGAPGSKSGPAVTSSGKTQPNNAATPHDASGVQGMPGNKSGEAPKR